MDEEIKRLLIENLAVSKENRKISKKLLSYRRLEVIYSVAKWLIFAGIALWTYYYLQPYLEQVLAVYGQMGTMLDSLPSFPGR
jgi:hypothetical protein